MSRFKEKTRMPLRGDISLTSFRRHGGNLSKRWAPIPTISALSSFDEFPAGYSLTRCSPAELVSASPAGGEYVRELSQVRNIRLIFRNTFAEL
jgi:hypothetical protein